MGDRFTRPNFLGERFAPKIEPSFAEGSITTVRSLKELPPSMLEKIPGLAESKTGYVVKQYNKAFKPNFSNHDLSLFDGTHLSTDNFEDFTLVDKTAILKRRQDELRRYFAEHDATNMITNSHFLIARDEQADFYLYEIQEKIADATILEDEHTIDLQSMDTESKQNLLSEVEKLEQIFCALLSEEDDPTFKKFIPDFHAENIVITPGGSIHIVDTNFWGFQWSSAVPEKVEESINKLKTLRDRLKRILAEK